ncbi:MAG: DUF2167 domain-containing protein [Acetobacteraceae bacterium]
MEGLLARLAAGVFTVLLAFMGLCGAGHAQAQADSPYQRAQHLPWHTAPAVLHIKSVALLDPGPDLKFLDPDATSTLLVISGNLPSNGEYAVAPKDLAWWSLFSYEATGHIKDDETLDPNALLATLKRHNREEQEERRKAGLPELVLEGWSVPPHYDPVTHNLEWGTRLISEGRPTINYTVRILGRVGIVNAQLVTDPRDFDSDLEAFRSALRRVSFVQGQRYAEFRQGDKMAAYGLGALIVGGAAAATASSGALKAFVKVIALGVMGALAAVGGFFKHRFGRKTPRA